MRKFLGRNDSRRVTLEHLFPHGNIAFSTPIWENGRYRQVVVEGETDTLQALGEYLRELALKTYIEEAFFGRWYGFGTHDLTDSLQVQYDSLNRPINQLQLLDLVLRTHLAKYCNLKLLPASVITGVSDGNKFMELNVTLPLGIENGTIELPQQIVKKIIH